MRTRIWVAMLAIGLLACGVWAAESDQVLLDEGDTIANWKGVQNVADPVKTGETAAKWTGANTGRAIRIEEMPHDWSGYSKLVLDLHSAKANGGTIIVTATSPGENKKGDYYISKIVTDWEGWKTIELPFDKFTNARKPTGWNSITALNFHTKGWNHEPKEDTELVLDNVRLVK